MYAEHRYQPQQSRAVSIGASLLISGAIITGMIYSAPNVVRIFVDPTIRTYNVPETVPPPPIDPPKEQPRIKAETRTQPPITPPKPVPALVGARRDPRYADAFQPNYPASELRAQRDGRVSVRVLVGPDGRVKAVEQVSATSAAFFEATKQQALSKWRFKPATRGGVAEESWMTLSVTFQIKDQ